VIFLFESYVPLLHLLLLLDSTIRSNRVMNTTVNAYFCIALPALMECVIFFKSSIYQRCPFLVTEIAFTLFKVFKEFKRTWREKIFQKRQTNLILGIKSA